MEPSTLNSLATVDTLSGVQGVGEAFGGGRGAAALLLEGGRRKQDSILEG